MYLSYYLLCIPKDGAIIFWNSFKVKSNCNIIKWKIAFLQNAEPQYHQKCITHWKCQMSLEHWAKLPWSCKFYRAWALCLWPEVPHFIVLTWQTLSIRIWPVYFCFHWVYTDLLDSLWPFNFLFNKPFGWERSGCLSAQESNYNNAPFSRNMSDWLDQVQGKHWTKM